VTTLTLAAGPPAAVRPLPVRLAGAAAVAVLLVLLFGAWEPRLATTSATEAAPAVPSTESTAPAIDAEAVVEQASHRIAAGPAGTLVVADDAYRARFDAAGFSYAPAGRDAQLTVSLDGVVRGGVGMAADRGAWTARGNVAERRVGPGTLERVTARDGEVEWDVVLAREPAGAGPLTVTGRLGGVTAATAASAGGAAVTRLQLSDGSTVELGELVVKDARGTTLHRARPEVHGSEIRLEVPAPLLEDAAYPLTLDPTVSGPVPLSSTGDTTSPRVAWSGSVFLVVWGQVFGADTYIYIAVADADGRVVVGADPLALGRDPDVVYSSSGVFKVVFESTNSLDPAPNRIEALDVRSDGIVVRQGIVDAGRWLLQSPSIASTGDRELVTWRDNRDGRSFDIRARRLFGARPDGDTFTVWGERPGFPVEDQVDPDVAWNGTVFMVAWREGYISSLRDVYVTRVSGAGTVLSTTPVSTGAHQEDSPEIASDGTNFLVVWPDDRNGTWDAYGARLDGSGNLLGPGTFPVVLRTGNQVPQSVAYNGTYLVAWRDNRNGNSDAYAGRVDGAGKTLDGTGFPVSTATVEENFIAVSRGGGTSWGLVYKSGIRSSAVIEWRKVTPSSK
jgi:hypothetical protein